MSAFRRSGVVRATLAAWLLAVAGCSAPAAEVPARGALAKLDALPDVEVVQDDAVEPEVVISAPEPGSARARALAALADADGLVLYSLDLIKQGLDN